MATTVGEDGEEREITTGKREEKWRGKFLPRSSFWTRERESVCVCVRWLLEALNGALAEF